MQSKMENGGLIKKKKKMNEHRQEIRDNGETK